MPESFFFISRDITDQVDAENELRHSEMRMKYLLGASPTVLYSCRVSGNYALTFVSPNISRMLGYEEGDVLQDPDFRTEKMHPDDRADFLAALAEAVAGGTPPRFEYRFLHRDGNYRWLRDDITVTRNPGGEAVEIVGCWNEVTNRKRAEAARQEAENKFQQLADNSFVGISVIQDGIFKYINPKYAEIFGYPVSRMLDCMPYLTVIHPDDRAFIEEQIQKRLEGKIHQSQYEFQGLRENGEKITGEIFASRIIYDNRPAVIGTLLDITSRKKVEEKLRTSLAEKEILLRELHHRVKNNIQVISSLLDMQSMSGKNPEVVRQLKEIQSKIRSMAMVHEKQYLSADLALIDLGDYVTDMSRELAHFYRNGKRDVTLTVKSEDLKINLDKAIPCGLIFNELIANALKHAFPDGKEGRISIRMRKTPDNEVKISVADNGIGLPQDIRINATRSIGLFLVQGLVKNQLRGNIRIVRNEGTEFKIKFTL